MTARPARGVVVLVGFMGAGKSSVGRVIAGRLGAEFVDLDERIEAAAGKSVREIFASGGEETFRAMEREAVREVVSTPGRVVAVGGGAFVDPRNRRLLKRYAPVVFLHASAEAVRARILGDRSRPLLPGDSSGIEELMARRASSYAEADFRVATDGRTVGEVADIVGGLIGRPVRRRR